MARDPIHPGETLREDLDALGMSAAELARKIEVPVNRITEILNGRRAVTGDTALRLGRFFGTSGEFWLNLQKLYELRRAERDNGKDIARLATISRAGDAASQGDAPQDADRDTLDAEEVLVLDSSTFVREIGLMSGKGSALKHYLYCRGMPLVVPQAAAEEYERNLVRRAKEKRERILKDLGWLAQFSGGIGGWQAPPDDAIEARAKALAAAGGLGAVLLSESADTRARAQLREQAERPPSRGQSGLGGCRIWEQCLDLLSDHDVVFVSDDGDFRSQRNRGQLHPQLRAEAEQTEGGRSLAFHPGMESLLGELKSDLPPIPEDEIFRFVYDAIGDAVRELESNSGCRPQSTGGIKQTRLTTEAREFIEVRLEVADTWASADGATVLPFQLSGSCRYHLGEKRLSDLKADVVRLLSTKPDGSVRAVKGGRTIARAQPLYLGTPPIQPEPATLE